MAERAQVAPGAEVVRQHPQRPVDEYVLLSARAHTAVERRRVMPEQAEEAEESESATGGTSGPKGEGGQSSRSRMNMKRMFTSLPLEKLGMRPAMITFTYPGDWREWVPDAATFERHRKALERAWVRHWGEPMVGIWAKEFQPRVRQAPERRMAPHLHTYLRLPAMVSRAEYEGLRERQRMMWRMAKKLGPQAARAKQPVIGGQYGGQLGWWLRTTWSQIVGTKGTEAERLHHARGVDVRVAFFNEGAAREMDRDLLSTYLAGESGKWQQKRRPENFPGGMRYFGYWGKKEGFYPAVTEVPMDPQVGRVMADVLARLVRARNVKLYGAMPKGFDRRRPGDGACVIGLGPSEAKRLVRFAEREVERAAGRRERSERRRNFSGA